MGRPRKNLEPLPPEPSEEEIDKKPLIEDDGLFLNSASLESQAKEKLSPSTLKVLKKIAYYTAVVGLPLEEACILSDVDFEKFQESRKVEPLIDKIVRMKELEYKKTLLATVSAKARSGDGNVAQWLLERRFSEEFGTKKAPKGDGGDIIFEAIQFIRRNGDQNDPLVSSTSGQAVVVRKSGEENIHERIESVLDQVAPPRALPPASSQNLPQAPVTDPAPV